MTPYTGPLELQGERGFAFHGRPITGIFQPVEDCNAGVAPCGPGDRISLHANWSSGDLPGTATLDGVTYTKVGGDDSSMTVDFSGAVTMPAFTGPAPVTVTAPFLFNGRFTYPGGREDLIGSGVVTLWMIPHPSLPGRWRIERLLYELGAPLPTPWVTADIGAVGLAGRSSLLIDTFVVAGAGADIWGMADSFRFSYQPLGATGSVIAKVASQEKAYNVPDHRTASPHPQAKAGVMIRESTSPSAASVVLDVKPDGGLEFMVRYSAGEPTTYLGGALTPGRDVWLGLARAGTSEIAASYSLDGVSWTPLGSVSIAFGSTELLAGLVVTSHDPAAVHGALFRDVRIMGPALTQNLLTRGDFEDYQPPALGTPGWTSDDLLRQVPAKSEAHQPRSGAGNGACWTPEYLDCGMYQEVTAPRTGSYTLRVYATADRAGGLVGANVNGATAATSAVEPAAFGSYALHSMTFAVSAGEVIRVWMYSPASPGYVVIDDASLVTADSPTRVVTSGTWTVSAMGSPFGSFALNGADFAVAGTYDYGPTEPLDRCRSGCAPGPIGVVAKFSNSSPTELMSFARGTAVFGGTAPVPWVEFGGAVTLTGGITRLPQPTGTNWPEIVTASTPFTMAGVLDGYDVVGVQEPRLVFTLPLTGQGTATVEMLAQPNSTGQIVFSSYRLRFEFEAR